MLARLLFDIAVSPFESRAVTSYLLLGALPALAAAAAEHLAELAVEHDDPVVRERVGRRLAGTMHGEMPPRAHTWLHGPDASGRDRALMLAGASGTPVADQVLRSALSDGPASRHAALYAIGMTGGPLLESLTTDSDDEVAGGARWWMRHGSRVVDVEAP